MIAWGCNSNCPHDCSQWSFYNATASQFTYDQTLNVTCIPPSTTQGGVKYISRTKLLTSLAKMYQEGRIKICNRIFRCVSVNVSVNKNAGSKDNKRSTSSVNNTYDWKRSKRQTRLLEFHSTPCCIFL